MHVDNFYLHMKYTGFLICFLLTVQASFVAVADDDKRMLDSLQQVLKGNIADTQRAYILNFLSQKYYWKDEYTPETSLQMAQEALALSVKQRFDRGIAHSYRNIAEYHKHKGSYATAVKYYQQALRIYQRIGDRSGEAGVHDLIAKAYREQGNHALALEHLYTSIRIHEALENKGGLADAYRSLAEFYVWQKEYQKALEYLHKALDLFRELENRQNESGCYNSLGKVYNARKDYDQALLFFRKALALSDSNGTHKVSAYIYINMSIAYKHKGAYDQAFAMMNNARQEYAAVDSESGIAFANSRLGDLYQELNRHREALTSYEAALEGYGRHRDSSGIAWTQYNIGKMQFALGNAAAARQWIMKAISSARDNHFEVVLRNAYFELYRIDSARGDFKQALQHYTTYIGYRDNQYNLEQEKKFALAELQYQFDKKQAAAAAEKDRKLAQTKQLYGAVLFLVCLASLAGYARFYIMRLKREKERQLLLKNNEIIALEKRNIEQELSVARTEVNHFLDKINEKNQLIEHISNDLMQLKDNYQTEQDIFNTALNNLRNTQILTNEDWTTYLSGFNRLYPNFTFSIKQKHPGITESELRYLMLTKLGLMHKEMANILGVSPDSIRVTWNRVRNKLGGSVEDSPLDLLAKLENEIYTTAQLQ
jgi:tetratricopeptide (TPR) repeat protein